MDELWSLGKKASIAVAIMAVSPFVLPFLLPCVLAALVGASVVAVPVASTAIGFLAVRKAFRAMVGHKEYTIESSPTDALKAPRDASIDDECEIIPVSQLAFSKNVREDSNQWMADPDYCDVMDCKDAVNGPEVVVCGPPKEINVNDEVVEGAPEVREKCDHPNVVCVKVGPEKPPKYEVTADETLEGDVSDLPKTQKKERPNTEDVKQPGEAVDSGKKDAKPVALKPEGATLKQSTPGATLETSKPRHPPGTGKQVVSNGAGKVEDGNKAANGSKAVKDGPTGRNKAGKGATVLKNEKGGTTAPEASKADEKRSEATSKHTVKKEKAVEKPKAAEDEEAHSKVDETPRSSYESVVEELPEVSSSEDETNIQHPRTSESLLLREIIMVQRVVGYKDHLRDTPAHEVESLYDFLGMEMPLEYVRTTDPNKLLESIDFLKAIVGVK